MLSNIRSYYNFPYNRNYLSLKYSMSRHDYLSRKSRCKQVIKNSDIYDQCFMCHSRILRTKLIIRSEIKQSINKESENCIRMLKISKKIYPFKEIRKYEKKARFFILHSMLFK